MCVYMVVTADQYELPIVVEDTVKELAHKLGLKPSTIYNKLLRNENGTKNGYRIRKVEINKED